MTAEQLIRTALSMGAITEEQGKLLRSYAAEHDARNRPSEETRVDWEAKRKLLEAESIRATQDDRLREQVRAGVAEQIRQVIEHLEDGCPEDD